MIRPLCACLLLGVAPVALPAQASDLQQQVDQALDAARPALLAHLREATARATRAGELALVVLAAVHDGVDPVHEAMAAATDKLADWRTDQTYDLALRLMVMEVLPGYPDRERNAARDAKSLLRNRVGGAFGYSPQPGGWDLSNTQYGALGLRAARAIGVQIDRGVWTRLADTIGEQQDNYGGFGYTDRRGRDQSYASMTAAGIAVLAICRQALGEGKRKTSTLTKRIARGWQWFHRNLDTIGSPAERWSYYFHYGLERAAILCDVEEVGGKSWYELGARMLVAEQLPSGGWRSASDGFQPRGRAQRFGSGLATSFAVLFLRRKFQKVAGPITPHIVTLPAVGPYSKPADVEACAKELVRRGKAALPEVLRALRSDIENQRRAAALALRGIAGEDFGYDPARDEEQNRQALKRAELWYLKNR